MKSLQTDLFSWLSVAQAAVASHSWSNETEEERGRKREGRRGQLTAAGWNLETSVCESRQCHPLTPVGTGMGAYVADTDRWLPRRRECGLGRRVVEGSERLGQPLPGTYTELRGYRVDSVRT